MMMATILIADDEVSIRTILSKMMEKKGYQVLRAKTGEEAYAFLTQTPVDVALVDIRMPELSGLDLLNRQKDYPSHPLIFVMTAQDTMENAVEAMKRGAFDYITKPFDLDELSLLVERALETRKLQTEVKMLREQQVHAPYTLVGKSKPLQEIFKTIGRVANQDVTVLIEGESGTGKELVAKAIHYQGSRAPNPFVAVNCSAIPRELLESELFGYKKGAFTGAVSDKAGYFEQAHLGTLFLDEIGELPLNVQAKLLRVLQEKEIQRVGDTKVRTVNVRIIAATNRSLKGMVGKGEFREDLFFRLNVVPLLLPPLRERRSDIPLLVDYFIQHYSNELLQRPIQIEAAAKNFLQKQDWPGNVRELENVIRRTLVLNQSGILTREDFEKNGYVSSSTIRSLPALEDLIELQLKSYFQSYDTDDNLHERFLEIIERPLIRLVLKKTGGNQIKAARLLGLNRNTLRKKIKDLKI